MSAPRRFDVGLKAESSLSVANELHAGSPRADDGERRSGLSSSRPEPVAHRRELDRVALGRGDEGGGGDADADAAVDRTESAPPSMSRPSGVVTQSSPLVVHPRGRILPPLPATETRARRLIRVIVRLAQGIYHHDDIFHTAPAMAFHFFLSLLPLLVFLGYVLALVAQRAGVNVVFGFLLHNLPATTESVLEKEMVRLAAADRLGPIAAVGFLWVASGGVQGLMQAIERVVGVPRRTWWRQRVIALVWVVALLVSVPIASLGIVEWNEVVHRSSEVSGATSVPVGQTPNDPAASEPRTSNEPRAAAPASPRTVNVPAQARKAGRLLRTGGERLVAMGFSFVVAVVALAAFYRFAVAYRPHSRRRVLPGAVIAVSLVIVISWAFSLYVRTLASYTVYYGGLAAIAVLLVWLWLMSLAILFGAELNSQLEGLRDHDEESAGLTLAPSPPNLEQ